jgi:hypothetical protein
VGENPGLAYKLEDGEIVVSIKKMSGWLLNRDGEWELQQAPALHDVDRAGNVFPFDPHPLRRFLGRVGLHDIKSDLSPMEGDYVIPDEPRLGVGLGNV